MSRKGSGVSKTVFEGRIKDALSLLLRSDLNDPRLIFMSVTKVNLNQDYSMATVFWDTFDSSKRGDIKSALEGVKGKVRAILSKKLNVRHTPNLTFIYDSQYEDEKKIEDLLNSQN